MPKMTREQAVHMANDAFEEWKNIPAEERRKITEFFIKYGRGGIGYRPLCRIIFSGMNPEEAVRIVE